MTDVPTLTEVTTTVDTGSPDDPILGAVPGAREDVTTSLYRAAIGPICPDFYLPVFGRFEAAGKAGLSWNSAASLLTFNWLVFRQLWAAALAYVGILVALGLLVFGIGRLVFQMSDEVSLVLLLVLGLAAFVAPGLLGNVLLHKQCRARMEHALANNPTLAEATSQLERQASSRRRLLWLVLGNLVVAGLAALVYTQWSTLTTLSVMPQGAAEARQTVSGLATDANSPLTNASAAAPAVTPALAPASAPAEQAASAPAVAASEPAFAATAATAASPVVVATSATLAPAAAAATTAPAKAPSNALSATVPTAAAAPIPAPALAPKEARPSQVQQPTPKPTAPKPVAKPAQPQKVAPPAPPAPPKASTKPAAPTPDAAPQELFYINVGLFSKPENANRVHAQLLEAGMPSVMKELKTVKERQIRVRVGPFASAEKAEAAAEKIKAMKFEAGIIQK